jgi:predicted anti-sigma-YlaC factor YlaD
LLTCKNIVESSSDYLEGQLTGRGTLAFRMHLLLCSHCRRFMRHLRLTIDSMRSLPLDEALPEDEIRAIIEQASAK